MSKKKENPYISRAEFSQAMDGVKGELRTLKIALVGEDLRGGLVKDVADIKNYLGTVKAIKDIIVPIIIAVASALITAIFLGKLP